MKSPQTEKTQPIFVLGRHRSGTTWLTNILASHPRVFTPEHEDHQGQHESAYFSNLLRYCRWGKTQPDRLALAAIFERSDYWNLLFPHGGTDLDIESLGVNEYFRKAMDKASRENTCTHWVENTPSHTLMIDHLTSSFPDAYFIAIRRNKNDTIRSNVFKFGDPNKIFSWIKAAVWTEIYTKILDNNKDKTITVHYEDLIKDFKSERERIFCQLGLNIDAVGDVLWKRDSSFPTSPPAVSLCFLITINLITAVFKLIPPPAAGRFVRIWLLVRRPLLPSWFFHVYHGKRAKD